jgi:hypothetical protein
MAKNLTMRRPALVTLTIVTTWTVGGLLLDGYVGRTGQLILGVLTAAVLFGLLALHDPAVRLQALAVVGFATMGEVVGSLIWGLYGYRLDNLPAFVPPGHGLVYLAGLALATLAVRHTRLLLGIAASGAAVWGLAGVTVLPATDLAGAIGCALLVVVLLRTRRPVYAGVFIAVAALELYGTAVGTWTWESSVPGLGLSQGNPPSGAASGYVVFDVLALALVARLTGTAVAIQSRRVRSAPPSTVAPVRISSRAASTLPQTSQSRNPRALPAPST